MNSTRAVFEIRDSIYFTYRLGSLPDDYWSDSILTRHDTCYFSGDTITSNLLTGYFISDTFHSSLVTSCMSGGRERKIVFQSTGIYYRDLLETYIEQNIGLVKKYYSYHGGGNTAVLLSFNGVPYDTGSCLQEVP